MAPTGWAYIPQACTAGAQCRVHVALHGCQQNVTLVQQPYVRSIGYNRWADNYNLVMIYPQTSTRATSSGWGWWGYGSANYAKKSGPQMVAIKARVDQVSAGSTTPPPAAALPAPPAWLPRIQQPAASSMTVSWSGVDGAASYNVYRIAGKVNALPVTSTTYS